MPAVRLGWGREASDAARRALRRAKYLVGSHPAGLPLLARLTPEGLERIVGPDTDLVVEGFPRSGNTFTAFALRHANPGISIASHIHHVGQLEKAVRLGRPTVVLLREPLSCLASYLLAGPHGRPAGVLREYIRYHRSVRELIPSLAVIRFESATSNMAGVTRAINDRFGLELVPFSDSRADVAAVFDQIDTHHRRHRSAAPHTHGVARPEGTREGERQRQLQLLGAPGNISLVADAVEIHDALASHALI